MIVSVTDTNDNRPTFQEESYSFSVSEMAPSGHTIATITAKDLDSGRFGAEGIRYSLSGTGSELFNVNERTGAITVAECSKQVQRKKRETAAPMNKAKNVNLTIVGQTGVIDIENTELTTKDNLLQTTQEEITLRPYLYFEDDYMVLNRDEEEASTISPNLLEQKNKQKYIISDFESNVQNGHSLIEKHHNGFDRLYQSNEEESGNSWTTTETYRLEQFPSIGKNLFVEKQKIMPSEGGPGHAPCLDYETQSVYFLSYKVCMYTIMIFCNKMFYLNKQNVLKATDDNGNGQSTLTAIRISLEDANDSPPTCESRLYRASLDEGARSFDPPLIIKARDADSVSQINYRFGLFLRIFQHNLSKYD